MTPVIDFRGVGRTHPGPPVVVALRPANLRVEPGEYVTVVGPSGPGKSTFLNAAGLLDRPSEGTYLLDGIDTAELGERDRTAVRGRRIGFVFRSFHLLPHRSALENVTLALLYTGTPRRRRRALAAEALQRVGLAHRTHALAGRLSGGERQRVAIARALVNRPSLPLCGEPTGNLDTATAQTVLALIDELHREGLTVVMVTHDAGVAMRARRTIVIRDGVLSEAGPAEQGPAAADAPFPADTEARLTRLDVQPAIFVGRTPLTVIGIIDEVDRHAETLLSVIVPSSTAAHLRGMPGGGDEQRAKVLIETRLGAAQVVGRQAAVAIRPEQPDRFKVTVPPDPRSLREGVDTDLGGLFLALAGICLVIGAGTGLLAGLYPAWRASRIEPVEALRR